MKWVILEVSITSVIIGAALFISVKVNKQADQDLYKKAFSSGYQSRVDYEHGKV